MGTDGLKESIEKMRADGVPDLAVRTFSHYYEKLAAGEQGTIAESDIEPVGDLPDLADLPEGDPAHLDQAVVIKLNGGLGTSMGMTRAKSLLEVKDGLSFLDIIARQVLHLRRAPTAAGRRSGGGARLPLVLMNSFYTRDDSLRALERYPGLAADVPLDFVQDKVPKLLADSLRPAEWPADPDLEWAPPGHGDLYTALVAGGMLETLLDHGYRYAFVSNSDNLGATLEPRILSWFAREEIPFLMEAADRTEADRKGGHLARRADDGGLLLRETAQTRDADEDAFQDIARHRYFNSNTLWVDLRALGAAMEERDGILGLPMIVNRKTVDPGDAGSPAVIQLETAMGAAIAVFEGARALRVPRRRFAPVKTTSDLLALRSDAYVLTEDHRVELAPERDGPPIIELDADHYKLLRDFDARFAAGPPSLIACERLAVEGDVAFGRDVVVRGSVRVEGPARIEDGAELSG